MLDLIGILLLAIVFVYVLVALFGLRLVELFLVVVGEDPAGRMVAGVKLPRRVFGFERVELAFAYLLRVVWWAAVLLLIAWAIGEIAKPG